MKVGYTRHALADIESIAIYLRERSPSGAERVGAAIRGSIERLATYPLSGRKQDDPNDVRKVVVPLFGYLVYYRVESETGIVILSVRHASQERLFDDR